MKKTTILAVSFVVLAVLAVWTYRKRSDSEQANPTVADSTEPSLPSVDPILTDDSVTVLEVGRPTAAVSEVAGAESDSRTELFSEPTTFGAPYLSAQERSVTHITAMQQEVPVTQTRILQANRDATLRFIGNILESPAKFDEPVEVVVFPEDVCRLSAVEHVNQTTVPGDLIVTGRCDSRPGSFVHIEFNAAMETLTFSIVDGQISHQIVPMRDTGFSLAMEMDYRSRGPTTF